MNRIKGKNHIKLMVIFAAMLAVVMAFAACNSDEAEESVAKPVDNKTFASGTTLDGENISGKTIEEAAETGRKHITDKTAELEISVKFKDDTVLLSGADFEIKDVLDLVLPKILTSGAAGDYETSFVVDLSQAGKQKIYDGAKTSYTAGGEPTVSGYDGESGEFTFTDGTKGSRADIGKTIKNIKQMLFQKRGGALQAEFIEVSPTISADSLKENFVKLGSYYTESSNTEAGNHNMALAMSYVNGTVLKPGQVFSFNDTVGDSTGPERGFQQANGISGGVLVGMYGGGICQASTTIYGAVMRSGLEIVMRECHSLVSSYCPVGLDATVDYGNIDFQFRNNMKTPIYIQGWMDGVELYCNIYGVQPEEWDEIEINSSRTETYDALTTVSFRQDDNLGAGEYLLKTSGTSGCSAVASRTYYKNGEVVKVEDLPSSYYPPTGKVYVYGPGTDTSKIDTGKQSGTAGDGTPKPSDAPTPATPVPSNGGGTQKTPTPATPVPATPVPATPQPDPATPEPVPDPTPEPATPEPEPTIIPWE